MASIFAPSCQHGRDSEPSLDLTTVAFDARPLNPKTRHWGVGVVIDHIVSRLDTRFALVGVSPLFAGAVQQGLRTWPRLARPNLLSFEASSLVAGAFDLYWGTNHFVPASCRRPSVVTVHDILLLKYHDKEPLSWLLARRLVASVKRANRILAVSRTTADDLMAAIPEARSKLEVALNGFDHFDEDGKTSEPSDKPYFMMLGAHRPRKNLALAATALHKLSVWNPGLRLLVTGDIHPCFADLLRAHPGLIQPTGVLPKRQLFLLLRGARAVLFPSQYEGFGFPLLEAMAAGCPVLALDIPINREIAGTAAWFLPEDAELWSQALRQLLTSASLRCEMAEHGFDNLKRFSWDRTAEMYAAAFAQAA